MYTSKNDLSLFIFSICRSDVAHSFTLLDKAALFDVKRNSMNYTCLRKYLLQPTFRAIPNVGKIVGSCCQNDEMRS